MKTQTIAVIHASAIVILLHNLVQFTSLNQMKCQFFGEVNFGRMHFGSGMQLAPRLKFVFDGDQDSLLNRD